MSDTDAKRHLLDMLESFRAGAVLHLLAEVVREAEAFLWVSGYGLMAALPR